MNSVGIQKDNCEHLFFFSPLHLPLKRNVYIMIASIQKPLFRDQRGRIAALLDLLAGPTIPVTASYSRAQH